MPARLSLVGDRYGRLEVLEMIYSDKGSLVRCRCDCGNIFRALAFNVRGGNTSSCGCLAREKAAARGRLIAPVMGRANATHGMSKTPTYVAWIEARKRCFNPQNERYHYYGGRGITMCNRWRVSFENFLADMGERPNGRTLDRIDNDGHYEPGNCRWATQRQQVSNRRNCVYLLLDGERVTCAEAARRLGITQNTVKRRLEKGLLPRWEGA